MCGHATFARVLRVEWSELGRNKCWATLGRHAVYVKAASIFSIAVAIVDITPPWFWCPA